MFSSLLIALSLVAGQPAGSAAKATPPEKPAPEPTVPSGAAKTDTRPPVITLYTMGRGELMVEKFGHAALCVKYRGGYEQLSKMCPFPSKVPPVRIQQAFRGLWRRLVGWTRFEVTIEGIDKNWVEAANCVWRHRVAARNPRESVCYNYGTTDFSDPIGLGWGFLRGRSKFWVQPQFFSRLWNIYTNIKDRSLWRQVLPLPPEKAWATARKLEHDVLEENKFYNYHHFYDNCTTRVRDIVNDAMDGKLKVDTDKRMGLSFRDYGAKGFSEYTWMLAISDFIFGRGGDVKPTLWQAMFLPRILRAEVDKRLGIQAEQVYKRRGPAFPYDEGGMGRGWTFLFMLLISAPLIASMVWGRYPRFGLWFATVWLSFIAIFIWLLAAVSTLYELRVNEACLLFWPSDVALPFLSPRRRMLYARVRVGAIVLVSLLAAVGILVQPLWLPILVAFVPLFAISRAWELVPQLAKHTSEKPDAAAGKSNGAATNDDEDDDGPDKPAPNMAAMRSKKSKKSKKRKRPRR